MSMVVPLYNEELRFDGTYWTEIIGKTPNVQWIFVDDGSTDGTLRCLNLLKATCTFQQIELDKNFGKAEALRRVMNLSIQREGIVGFIDSDGSFDIQEVADLCNFFQLEENWRDGESYFSAIFMTRDKHTLGPKGGHSARRVLGKLLSLINKMLWRELPKDTQCGFKLFFIDELFSSCLYKPFNNSWFFEIELLMRLKKGSNFRNLSIREIPLRYCEDVPGSKVINSNTLDTFSQVVRTIVSIAIFQLKKKYFKKR